MTKRDKTPVPRDNDTARKIKNNASVINSRELKEVSNMINNSTNVRQSNENVSNNNDFQVMKLKSKIFDLESMLREKDETINNLKDQLLQVQKENNKLKLNKVNVNNYNNNSDDDQSEYQ